MGALRNAPLEAQVRRIGPREIKMRGRLDESPVKASESTFDEKLRHIFQYFCSYGDRANSTHMSSSKFYKFLKACKVLDNTFTHQQVDIVYKRAVAEETAAEDDLSGTITNRRRARVRLGARMDYDAFTAALADVAARKYPDMPVPQALRMLLSTHVMPIYKRLKLEATFVLDVVREGAAEMSAAFEKEFVTVDVLKFVDENRAALQSLFTRYAMMNAPAGASRDWTAVRDSHTTMDLKEFLKFAVDFRLMPEKISRPDLIKLFKEANQGFMEDDNADELCYPEFVELLGMLAMNLFNEASRGDGSSALLPSAVSKLHMLIYYMQSSGKFVPAEYPMVRKVVHAVKDSLHDRARREQTAKKQQSKQDMQRVKDVLMESVYA
jgi:hypothetical protein